KTLQSLEVSLCDITELDVNASTFKDYRLKILKLSGNLISRITPQAGINPLIFLEELYLDLNGLQHLANAFAHGTSNLRILDLSDNCISTLEASSLSALHKLEKLDLKSNLLRDDSVSMRAFEEVGLEASQFSLNLSYNALQSFPPLQPLCAYVTELNLNGNPLKSVPRLSGERGYAFDTLKILHIHSYLRSAEDNALLVRKMKTKTPQNCRIVTDIETVDGYETPEE
ncbi:leucine-rich repeat domain-containing protein, partial [Candidatus Dependentiae bacterium]|nr:leucine-rich repeat domain-containing protein [Candidatus Dependentiae bacterium]